MMLGIAHALCADKKNADEFWFGITVILFNAQSSSSGCSAAGLACRRRRRLLLYNRRRRQSHLQ